MFQKKQACHCRNNFCFKTLKSKLLNDASKPTFFSPLANLRTGDVDPLTIPRMVLDVVQNGMQLLSIDNRRLKCFKLFQALANKVTK